MTRSIFLLAAMSLFGCRQIDGGPELSETRTLDAFTRVRIEDGLTAKLSPGTPQATINAPEKVVANLETVVKSGTLIVRLKPNVIVTDLDSTEVLITGEAVVAAETTGGSHLTATEVDISPFRATASGGSHLEVSGRTADARLNASGGSGIDATKLLAEVASVEATGGSTIDVSASKSVEGTASGGSHVTVTGGADATAVSSSGGSSVNAAN
ncbi:MAG: DUF2807 domain-containing protein [Archangium sp.]|nr:DUF2807 domain-containing protein [Archangium sp.]